MVIDTNDFLGSIMAPQKNHTDILVMGVGGAGGNAVAHMYDLGIQGVSFMICNTDRQALEKSPIEYRLQLGPGLGAGNNPDKGRALALEALDDIMMALEESKAQMVFITAGMGGGTGTGAAPIIAKAAKSKGLLTVAIVTLPFSYEGPIRKKQALAGLEELKACTDSLVVIHNDNISKMYGSLPITEALHKADDVLATAAKGMAEMITRPDFINVDLEDARTTMTDSGIALMGSGKASGEDRVERVVDAALTSPLLNQPDIRGARKILVNLSYATEDTITFDEAMKVVSLIQSRASKTRDSQDANIIWGAGPSNTLDKGENEITVIATSFDQPANEENKMEEPIQQQEERSDIQWNYTERYNNIDDILMQPAYLRRNMQLIGASAATRSLVDKGLAADDASAEASAPQAAEQTLFG
jgi:cell division protein FtsZ